ncbi:hypothetical protein C8F01DRAFT_1245599 [Mycena amicta]|nr:hypothetical protein C8F01DRAFT_1245599 [Mycena amicta]
MAQDYFGCDACERTIPAQDPRVRCLDCAGDYDLCAACALGERFTRGHTGEHRVRVFKVSGGGPNVASVSSIAIVYGQGTSPPPPTSTNPSPQVYSTTTSPPIQYVGSPPPGTPPLPKRMSMPPPLPARNPRVSSAGSSSPGSIPPRGQTPNSFQAGVTVSQGGTSAPVNAYIAPASNPPQQQQAQAPHCDGWGPFFAPDLASLPPYLQLLDAIFTYLDTGRTGYLVPEAYSHFLNDQNYVGQENVWNANLIATYGQTKEDVADSALKRAYDLFSIEYILRPRPRDPNAPVDALTAQIQATLGPSFARTMQKPSVSGGMMPLLTRKGFADITAVELLGDPSRGWGGLSRIIQMYGLETQLGEGNWGSLPRSVLPEEADPRVLARVARVQAFAQDQAKMEIQANYAKLKLQQQGRDNALALLDDRRYVY